MTAGNMDLSTLQRFRADIAEQATDGPPPPLQPRVIRDGTVLSFDQSLGATGYTVLDQSPTSALTCVTAATITAPKGLNLRSNLDMLTAGEHLYEVTFRILTQMLSQHPGLRVVHETPPNAGKVKGSGTSSLVSAMAIRAACKAHGITAEVIGRQTWAKFICGSSNAEKKVVHGFLHQFVVGGGYPTNEGQRDALCLALTALGEV